jgi:hypothetical protein
MLFTAKLPTSSNAAYDVINIIKQTSVSKGQFRPCNNQKSSLYTYELIKFHRPGNLKSKRNQRKCLSRLYFFIPWAASGL